MKATMNDEAMNGEAMNDDRSEFELRSDWSGRVPKPGAVLMLQIVGALGLLFGIGFWILQALVGFDFERVGVAYISYSVTLALMAAPFALLSGYRRPPGLVAGVVAMAILLVGFPFLTLVTAVVGFFAIKNRDHVRDYYSQPRVTK